MNVYRLPFALFAFFAFVMVVPGWMWFVKNYQSNLTSEGTFIATLVLPALAALALASWIQPRSG